MKKLLPFILLSLLMFSCKKNYYCECQESTKAVTTRIIITTKKNAQAECEKNNFVTDTYSNTCTVTNL